MNALQAYANAWSRRGFVVPIYLGARLLSFALIAPITGALTSVAVSLSGQSALTDLDIAQFFLTPIGFLVAIGIAAILLIGSFLGFTAMAVDLQDRTTQGLGALYTALHIMASRLVALLSYAALLALRILAIVMPFALAGILVAHQLLGAHDINYYLSARPPEFYWAATIIGVLSIVAAIILVRFLLSWALSLHMVLFAGIGPNAAFSESLEQMTGKRRRLLRTLLSGLAIHLGIVIGLAVIFGWLLQVVPGIFEGLRTSLTIVMVIGGTWALVGMVLNAVSLGALASILDALYRETNSTEHVSATTEIRRFSFPILLLACLILAIFGFVAGGIMLDRVQTEDDVEIIAHRGAAGTRPENTLASVRKAIEDKADWIEIEVQETDDG